jgi:hypothetical protein
MTRLIWVVILVLLLGVLFLFFARTMQSGAKANPRIAEISAVQQELSSRFPDSRFRILISRPGPEVRNLVVTIQPGKADSARLAEMVESSIAVLRSRIKLVGYDSLLVAVFDSVWRAEPTAAR